MTMFRFLVIAAQLGIGLYARSAKAQPDCNGWNSIGFFETATAADVRRCLAAGADLKARLEEDGVTPLHFAVFKGHAQTVAALIKAGAEVNARNKGGDTPLHYAAQNDHVETVTALVRAGANIAAKDHDGNLPADLAWDSDTLRALDAAR